MGVDFDDLGSVPSFECRTAMEASAEFPFAGKAAATSTAYDFLAVARDVAGGISITRTGEVRGVVGACRTLCAQHASDTSTRQGDPIEGLAEFERFV